MDKQETGAHALESAPLFLRMLRECLDETQAIAAVQAPGRVNLIGDHTDYNDGYVLPMTIDRAVYVVLRQREDEIVHLHAFNFDEEVRESLHDLPARPSFGWARYVLGVVRELHGRRGLPTGFEGLIYGTVPLGAGLSSSAAIEVAVALALGRLFELSLDPINTAKLCQYVEHEYAGVECGIMDQFTSRLGKSGHALFLDCRTLGYEHIPLQLEELSVVITDSRVSRELASSKYNERRAECREAVRLLRRHDPDISALRDVTPELLEAHGHELPPYLLRRSRHVVSENERVLRSRILLQEGRMEAFGQLMNASHASLRDDYEVTIPELDFLVEAAQETEGVLGARMTGAGFGGSTVTLARRDAVPHLKEQLTERYEDRFGRKPEVYVVDRNLEAGPVWQR